MTAFNNTVGAQHAAPLQNTIVQIAKFMTVGVLNTAIDAGRDLSGADPLAGI